VVSSMKELAGAICAAAPSRFCCNAPWCVNLSTVSEGLVWCGGPAVCVEAVGRPGEATGQRAVCRGGSSKLGALGM
jgi:hypothetical protein